MFYNFPMTKLVAGNWKMNLGPAEARLLAKAVASMKFKGVEVGVAPPFPYIPIVAGELVGSEVLLGAQNLFWEDWGAYTGEVSAPMLRELGVQFVIVGHSERRRILGETDEMVNKKLKKAIEHGLRPILCVGESLEEREAGKAKEVVARQLGESLKGVLGEFDVAYEPVWAIGTGRNATPEQASEMHLFIKEELGKEVRVLYGGSVKPENASELIKAEGVDGFLVGGASLKPESFWGIIEKVMEAG